MRSIFVLILGFVFSAGSSVVNFENTSNGYPVFTTQAFAFLSTEKNGAEITYVKYSLQTILDMTPKQLIGLSTKFNRELWKRFLISGFSVEMSRQLKNLLNSDVFLAKKLLREMRRAKTKKQRKKVLKKYSDQLEKEQKKLEKKIRKLEKKFKAKRKSLFGRVTLTDRRKLSSLLRFKRRIIRKLKVITNWANDVTEGTKVDKLQ